MEPEARFLVKFSDGSETTYTESNLMDLQREPRLAESVTIIGEELPKQPEIK